MYVCNNIFHLSLIQIIFIPLIIQTLGKSKMSKDQILRSDP